MDGEPGLQVTGQLGDVMSESAQIALSFVRANAEELEVPADAFDKRRFHLHVPSGSDPEGRTFGRHHDDDRVGILGDGSTGEAECRDDR